MNLEQKVELLNDIRYKKSNFQESNDFNHPKNFSNDLKKEYKASTLDWLGGQARI